MRTKELGRQGVDAAHLGGMVHDKRQGGKEKRIENSVTICGATPDVSQINHVLTLLADLGQGRLRLKHLLTLTSLASLASPPLEFRVVLR